MGAGRPPEYKEEYIGEVTNYLEYCKQQEGVYLPTKNDFAIFWLGVSKSSLYEWEKTHPEFSYALSTLMNAQEKYLVDNGLGNIYNPTITKLLLGNNHGYAEKTQTDVTSKGEKVMVVPPSVAERFNLNGTDSDTRESDSK